ncbi:MAG: AtpZ/AtpI family protein [Ilumatobacteraceae bacterium]
MKSESDKQFSSDIGKKEDRKLEAQRHPPSALSGMRFLGLVGWSVAVPATLGALAGAWLDRKYPEPFSWTLSLLVGGLMIGCLIAWNWVSKANSNINKKTDDHEP